MLGLHKEDHQVEFAISVQINRRDSHCIVATGGYYVVLFRLKSPVPVSQKDGNRGVRIGSNQASFPSPLRSAATIQGLTGLPKLVVVNVIWENGLVMPRNTGVETPPPGLGLLTVTVPVPADATSDAEIAAVNCELLTKVVVLGLPFQFTTDPETKPVPFTVSVNAALPGTTVVGTNGWFTNGTGFDCPSSEVARKTITLKTARVDLIVFLPQIVDEKSDE